MWRFSTPFGERATTGEIGSAKALYIGLLHRITSRIDPRSQKTLALIVALILSVVSFFAAREAQAQQPAEGSSPEEASQQFMVTITDGEVVQRTGGEPLPNETSPTEKPSPPPVDSVPPAPKPEPVPTTPKPEPAPQQFAVVTVNGEVTEYDSSSHWPVPDPVQLPDPVPANGTTHLSPAPEPENIWSTPEPKPSDQYDNAIPVDADGSVNHVPPTDSTASEPLDLGQVSGPVFSDEGKPLPASYDAEKGSAQLSPASVLSVNTRPVPASENEPVAVAAPIVRLVGSASSAVRPEAPPQVLSLPPRERFLPSLEAAVSGMAKSVRSAVASVLQPLTSGSFGPSSEEPEVPSGGVAPRPLEDTPPPLSPFSVPTGGSSFSLFIGGQSGAGVGVTQLLLFSILASVLVLPRKEGRLSLISCELPKPSSALLPPLERPG